MSESKSPQRRLSTANRWTMGAGVLIFAALSFPLWLEFHEPGKLVWNVILAAMLIGIVVAAFLIQRYLMLHIDEVGEARFDTTNRERRDG